MAHSQLYRPLPHVRAVCQLRRRLRLPHLWPLPPGVLPCPARGNVMAVPEASEFLKYGGNGLIALVSVLFYLIVALGTRRVLDQYTSMLASLMKSHSDERSNLTSSLSTELRSLRDKVDRNTEATDKLRSSLERIAR